ncbi:reverse transcriptase domain-containing protein [Tanacetum coccineum]
MIKLRTIKEEGKISIKETIIIKLLIFKLRIFKLNGVAYNGPTIPPTSSPPKEVERETEATKDKMQNTSLGSTAHVQPLVVQDPIPEPKVASKTNPKLSIPYPSRLNDQKLHEKANNQIDPSKFLIPCDFSELDECLALADLGASINLMPLSVWNQLSLPELTLTRMTLELADRSVAHPKSVVEDVFVKVGKFYFLADFVVVDYDVDPRVPLIFGRPFLRTARALIDVDDVACEEYAQEVLGFSDSSSSVNPTPLDPIIASSSPSFTPFEGGDFILEEIETFLHPSLTLPPMKNDDLKQVDVTMTKPSTEEPPELELKDLPSHLEYAFLEGTDKLPVIISKEVKEDEKATLLKVLKSHKRAIAWKISDIKGIDLSFCTHKILMEDDFKSAVQHQRRVNPKIHEVIKKEVIKLLDDGLISPISDSPWVSPVHCVPKKGGMTVVENDDNELIPTRSNAKRCKDTNLVLNWEKCHFMVKEGVVLGHKISKSGIKVDRVKVDVIAKLPHLTSVKEKETPFVFSKECIEAFNILKKKLTEALILVAPDWDLPFEIMCDASDYAALKYLLAKQDAKPRLLWWILLLQEFDVIIRDKKGAKNLAADHLSRLENPHQGDLEKKEITETFPLETLGIISSHNDSSTPWFADIANYHAGNFLVKGMSSQQKKNSLRT